MLQFWSSSVLAVHLSLTLLNWRPVDPHLAASQPMILEASCPWRPVVSHSGLISSLFLIIFWANLKCGELLSYASTAIRTCIYNLFRALHWLTDDPPPPPNTCLVPLTNRRYRNVVYYRSLKWIKIDDGNIVFLLNLAGEFTWLKLFKIKFVLLFIYCYIYVKQYYFSTSTKLTLSLVSHDVMLCLQQEAPVLAVDFLGIHPAVSPNITAIYADIEDYLWQYGCRLSYWHECEYALITWILKIRVVVYFLLKYILILSGRDCVWSDSCKVQAPVKSNYYYQQDYFRALGWYTRKTC